jgi:hypothetical protein
MKYLAFFILLLFSNLSYSQSPWSAAKGEGFLQIGGSYIGGYNTLFTNQNSDFITSRILSDFTLQLYGEYGLGKGWETSLAIPLVTQTSGDISENPSITPTIAQGSLTSLGNIHLGIKKVIYNQGILFSAGIKAELNTSSFDETTGLRTGYGAWGIAPSIMAGKGMDKWYAYITTGPTLRSNGYSAEWRIQAEGGYKIGSKSYMMLNVFILESFQNGDVILPQTNLETGFFVNNQSFFSYGPKFMTQFSDHLGMTAAVYLAGSGNQVAKSPSLNLGVFAKF